MTDTTVRLKRSSTSGGVPNVSDLSLGELAVNTFDGKLFFKKDNGTASIIEVGAGSGGGGGGGPSTAVKVLLYEKTNTGNADSFDGSETRFQLRDESGTVISNLTSASQLLISIDGVVQEPNSGSSGTDGFYISNTSNGTDIIFLAAPASGSDFFGMVGILSGSFATVATTGDYDDLTNKPNLSLKANLDSSGRLLVGTTTGGTAAADNITLEDSGDCGITIRSGSSSHGSIYFADGLTQPAIYAGFIDYQHNIDMLRLGTGGGQTRMVIDSLGSVSVGSTATSGTGVHLRPFGNVISRRASGSLQVFEGYQGSTLTSQILANGNAIFTGNVGVGTSASSNNELSVLQPASDQSGGAAIKAVGTAYGTNKAIHAYIASVNVNRSLIYAENQNGVVMNVNAAGNIGIGISTPQRDLHIHNPSSSTNTYLQLTSATTGTGSTDGFQLFAYGSGGNTNAAIVQRENAALEIWTSNTERMQIDSTGNLKLRNTGKFILAEGTNDAFSISTSGANGNLTFRDEWNNSDVITISNSGRVGMGTSSPAHALHVTGDIRAGTTSYNDYGIKAYTNSSAYGGIYAQNNHASGFVFTGNNGSANTVLIKSDGKIETTGDGSFYTVNRTNQSGTAALYLGFADSSQKFKVGIDGTGTFAGKIGIGTTTPAKDLEIFKDSFPCLMLNDGNQYKSYMQLGGNDLEIRGSSGRLEFYTGSADGLSSDHRMCITNVGDVAIGSTSPVNYSGYNTLTLNGTNGSVVEFLTSGTKKGTIYSTPSFFYIQTRSSVGIEFLTSDTPRMSLDSTGDLKLRNTGKFILTEGTTNAFSISTTGANGSLNFRDEYNNYNVITINNSGRVGIGTTQPSRTLTVQGDMNLLDGANIESTSSTGTLRIQGGSTYPGGTILMGGGTGTNDIRFSTTGQSTSVSSTEKMRLDSSGRLLVGTTSPTTSSVTTRISAYSSSNDWMLMEVGAIQSGDTGGVYGVRSRAASYNPIAVAGAFESTSSVTLYFGGGWGGYGRSANNLRFYTSAALDNASGTSGTQRMDIGSSGQVNVFAASTVHIARTATGAGAVQWLYAGAHSASNTNSGTVSFLVYTNGNVQNTNDSYGQISDVKLKENIVDAGSQWDDFKAVRFRKYNFKEETGYETHTQLGIIAQELELVSPGLVYESPDRDEDGNELGTTTKAVKSSILTKKALVALQEAMARIETLEQRLSDASIA